MKKILLPLIVSLVFFVAGLIGTFMAMPIINPDLVEETQNRLDSLALTQDSTFMIVNDSLVSAHIDSLSEAANSMEPMLTRMELLQDSIKALHSSLSSGQVIQSDMVERLETLESRLLTLDEKYAQARAMSGTIVKLEDAELGELLNELSLDVLEAIYIEATARNRSRLLQMLPADKAAYIVSKLASPTGEPALPSTNEMADTNEENK